MLRILDLLVRLYRTTSKECPPPSLQKSAVQNPHHPKFSLFFLMISAILASTLTDHPWVCGLPLFVLRRLWVCGLRLFVLPHLWVCGLPLFVLPHLWVCALPLFVLPHLWVCGLSSRSRQSDFGISVGSIDVVQV